MTDLADYVTYVFEILDKEFLRYSKYIMCTKFPNWETKLIAIGDIGYLHFEEIEAGKDRWWDGNKFVSYRYDMTQFINFVPEPTPEDNQQYIM